MALVSAEGLPIALDLYEAGPHEATLAFDLVQGCWTEELPERVIGDKAYDSDGLDERLWQELGVEITHARMGTRRSPGEPQEGQDAGRSLFASGEASLEGGALLFVDAELSSFVSAMGAQVIDDLSPI